MRALGACIAVVALAALAGCQTAIPAPACPAGQTFQRTAQLFFGRSGVEAGRISEAAFRKYVDEELTPRFPDGLTVMDGGGKWRGEENRLIRDATKVVSIVLPNRADAERRVAGARAAYRSRFHQESGMVVTQGACVAL